jgi:hypothetical protein
MITRLNPVKAIALLLLAFLSFTACKKEVSSTNTPAVTSPTIAIAATETVASGTSGNSSDTVYVIQPCERGFKRVAIAESDLPASVTAYLTTNYPGYTFSKAFAIQNNTGTATGYVVILYFNNKPVAILFDSSGSFVKVLEQREKGDLDGQGWHDGGRFCDRDGRGRDTIALNALPPAIIAYMATNYSSDTLIKAFQGRHDSDFVVLSKNNGLFANVFDKNGNFIKRVSLPVPAGSCVSIDQSALPGNVQNYLSTSYPNYVFEKAFAIYRNNALQGYLVIINANNTKYGVRFDASGNFISVKTIW